MNVIVLPPYYLAWNNLVNYENKQTDAEKANIFPAFVLTTLKKDISRELSNRPAIPLIV